MLTLTDRSDARLHVPSRATFATGGLEVLATAVVALNTAQRISYVNPAAENLFKISQRHVLNVPLAEVFPESPDLEGLVEQARVRSASFTLHGLTVTPAGQPKVEVSCTASRARFSMTPGTIPKPKVTSTQRPIASAGTSAVRMRKSTNSKPGQTR